MIPGLKFPGGFAAHAPSRPTLGKERAGLILHPARSHYTGTYPARWGTATPEGTTPLLCPIYAQPEGNEMGKTAKNYGQISKDTISCAIRAYKRTRGDTAKTIANAIGAEIKTVESWLSPSTPAMPDFSNIYALIDYWGAEFGSAVFAPINMEMREIIEPEEGPTEIIKSIHQFTERYLKEAAGGHI